MPTTTRLSQSSARKSVGPHNGLTAVPRVDDEFVSKAQEQFDVPDEWWLSEFLDMSPKIEESRISTAPDSTSIEDELFENFYPIVNNTLIEDEAYIGLFTDDGGRGSFDLPLPTSQSATNIQIQTPIQRPGEYFLRRSSSKTSFDPNLSSRNAIDRLEHQRYTAAAILSFLEPVDDLTNAASTAIPWDPPQFSGRRISLFRLRRNSIISLNSDGRYGERYNPQFGDPAPFQTTAVGVEQVYAPFSKRNSQFLQYSESPIASGSSSLFVQQESQNQLQIDFPRYSSLSSLPLGLLDTPSDQDRRFFASPIRQWTRISSQSPRSFSSGDDCNHQNPLRFRRRISRSSAAKAVVLPQEVAGKKWVKPNPVTRGLNRRSANINEVDPSLFYKALEKRPESWGGPKGFEVFRYSKNGELIPGLTLRSSQILQFIRDHPLHRHAADLGPSRQKIRGNTAYSSGRDTTDSRLILWVQTAPADSARRYLADKSSKCRFEGCPVKFGTIAKGSFRVAFDENSWSGIARDPFHCAGFVHLFCLEKFCNFPSICRLFNVQPDTRKLPEGRNRMAIDRDHEELADEVDEFIDMSRKTLGGDLSPPESVDFPTTLTFKLTTKHLDLQSMTRQRARKARGGNTIDKHLGNLDVYCLYEEAKRSIVKERRRKRRAKESEDESEQEGEESSPPKRYSKRIKASGRKVQRRRHDSEGSDVIGETVLEY